METVLVGALLNLFQPTIVKICVPRKEDKQKTWTRHYAQLSMTPYMITKMKTPTTFHRGVNGPLPYRFAKNYFCIIVVVFLQRSSQIRRQSYL